jgi:hypothetical protein
MGPILRGGNLNDGQGILGTEYNFQVHMHKACEISSLEGDMFIKVAPIFDIANVYGTYILFLILKPLYVNKTSMFHF